MYVDDIEAATSHEAPEVGHKRRARPEREMVNAEPRAGELRGEGTRRGACCERMQVDAALTEQRSRLSQHHFGTRAFDGIQYVKHPHRRPTSASRRRYASRYRSVTRD